MQWSFSTSDYYDPSDFLIALWASSRLGLSAHTMVYAQITDRQRREGFRKMELSCEVVKV